jgi:hypothetical protein
LGFKLLGIALLIASAYLVVNTLAISGGLLSDTGRAGAYPLIAIVLVLMVRVLQAEKHHREHKQ